MQTLTPGVIICTQTTQDSTNRKTGEVIEATGYLFYLISNAGLPIMERIKCSVAAARHYAQAGIVVGQSVRLTQLMIDVSEYNVNGKSGISKKLVEEGSAAQVRGTFTLDAPVAVRPPVAPPGSQNGQASAPALARV